MYVLKSPEHSPTRTAEYVVYEGSKSVQYMPRFP